MMKSKYGKEHSEVGSIIVKNCRDLGALACEVSAKSDLKTSVKEINPNEDMVKNKRIKLANGDPSDFFTGIYYIITSKFENAPFSNRIYSNVSENI